MGSNEEFKRVIPDGGNVFYTEYYDEPPSQAIVRGISSLEGEPVEDIPPLYDYVHLESMNQLMETARDVNQDVAVHVVIEDYEISIESDGTLSIRDCAMDSDAFGSE